MATQEPTVYKFRKGGLKALAAVAVAGLLASQAVVALADQASIEEGIQQYRDMLSDGNPAELAEYKGEDLWKQKQGPKNASLEQCDLGLGAGVLKGAFAQMPRYFADTHKVMDLETRLVYCMQTLQGRDTTALEQHPFSKGAQPQTELEALAAYVSAQSKGMPVNLPQSRPEERAARARGEKLFFYRSGPYDFACASCHGVKGQRIRLQELPELSKPEDARNSFTAWPAYRVSEGAVRTMQWRIYDCFRQQRFPALKFGSQASIDLITYLGVTAKGGIEKTPALKR